MNIDSLKPGECFASIVMVGDDDHNIDNNKLIKLFNIGGGNSFLGD